jgi:hypothetical protein
VITQLWKEMAVETLSSARRKITVKEFKNYCNMITPEVGKSFYDRIRVAEFLIEQETILVSDGRLILNQHSKHLWLENEIFDGSENAWEIAQAIDVSGELEKKFDNSLQVQLGLEGELAFISYLEANLPDNRRLTINHVSLVDDTAGYDVSCSSAIHEDEIDLFEVKTSSRISRTFNFFITRNELKVGNSEPNWRIAAMRKVDSKYEFLGLLRLSQFSSYLPKDIHVASKWTSASVAIPVSEFSKLEI